MRRRCSDVEAWSSGALLCCRRTDVEVWRSRVALQAWRHGGMEEWSSGGALHV